jgi:hypothetical protein
MRYENWTRLLTEVVSEDGKVDYHPWDGQGLRAMLSGADHTWPFFMPARLPLRLRRRTTISVQLVRTPQRYCAIIARSVAGSTTSLIRRRPLVVSAVARCATAILPSCRCRITSASTDQVSLIWLANGASVVFIFGPFNGRRRKLQGPQQAAGPVQSRAACTYK